MGSCCGVNQNQIQNQQPIKSVPQQEKKQIKDVEVDQHDQSSHSMINRNQKDQFNNQNDNNISQQQHQVNKPSNYSQNAHSETSSQIRRGQSMRDHVYEVPDQNSQPIQINGDKEQLKQNDKESGQNKNLLGVIKNDELVNEDDEMKWNINNEKQDQDAESQYNTISRLDSRQQLDRNLDEQETQSLLPNEEIQTTENQTARPDIFNHHQSTQINQFGNNSGIYVKQTHASNLVVKKVDAEKEYFQFHQRKESEDFSDNQINEIQKPDQQLINQNDEQQFDEIL